MTVKPDTPMRAAVAKLVEVCGYNKSESASEWFLVLLTDAVEAVFLEVDESHKDHLCLDVTSALASQLAEKAPAAVREYHSNVPRNMKVTAPR
jgi:hypothetical protein